MKFTDIDHGNSFDFGKTAAQYAKYRDIYPKELYDKLYALGVGHNGDSWLDIGTGTGVLPKNMAHYGAEITGVDISEDQIAFAKQQPEAEIYNIHYIACSAEHIDLPDSCFDSITAAQCFWYFDREQIVSEIKRIIKPGGVFVKVCMTYILDDKIARSSHELIKRMNKNWTPGASGSRDMYKHPFDNAEMDVFLCDIPFTRESWHGRMTACRGTLASMDKETFEEWSKRHLRLLSKQPEAFTVRHKIYIASYRVQK